MGKNIKTFSVTSLLIGTLLVISGCDNSDDHAEILANNADLVPVNSSHEGALTINNFSLEDEATLDFYPVVVATVNDKDITKQEFVEYLKTKLPNGQFPVDMTKEKLTVLVPKLLEEYILSELILADAKKIGITPSYNMVKERLQAQYAKYNKTQLTKLNEDLRKLNMTLDEYIDSTAKVVIYQKTLATETFKKQEIDDKVELNSALVKKYYDENRAKFTADGDAEGSIRASHILVKSLEQANEIRKELEENPDKFVVLAQKYSDCPSKSKGGALGVFSKGDMIKEFSDAAFALEEGETSEPVKTSYGYHIIRREYSQKGGELSFEMAKLQIEPFLLEKAKEEAFKSYCDNLLKENSVIIVEPELEK